MKKIAIVFIGMFLIACNRQARESNIIKVQLVRSGAWSDYGAAISMDSSLNYHYYSRNLKYGYFGGKISRRFWDSLNQKFEKLKFRTLGTDPFATSASDGQHYDLIVYWKDGKTSIQRGAYYDSLNPVDKAFHWLNNSFKEVRLRRLKYAIKFEATFEDIPPLPADSSDFIPPLLDK